MASLKQILHSRDARQSHQQSLLREHPGETLICLTVIMPGESKRNANSLIVAGAAMCALMDRFGAGRPYVETRDLETGFEAYMLISEDVMDVKRAACLIEDTHPLGRLFDIDVITEDGPVSRSVLGLPERGCIICGRPARECMRAHTHSHMELMTRIDHIIQEFVSKAQ